MVADHPVSRHYMPSMKNFDNNGSFHAKSKIGQACTVWRNNRFCGSKQLNLLGYGPILQTDRNEAVWLQTTDYFILIGDPAGRGFTPGDKNTARSTERSVASRQHKLSQGRSGPRRVMGIHHQGRRHQQVGLNLPVITRADHGRFCYAKHS
ncbi:hypothetical protein D3C80_1674340 [compost metagenome]